MVAHMLILGELRLLLGLDRMVGMAFRDICSCHNDSDPILLVGFVFVVVDLVLFVF